MFCVSQDDFEALYGIVIYEISIRRIYMRNHG